LYQIKRISLLIIHVICFIMQVKYIVLNINNCEVDQEAHSTKYFFEH
jgi:hypothetical protein